MTTGARQRDVRPAVDASSNPARLPDTSQACGRRQRETRLGWFDSGKRRTVAVVITADGRRVHLPVDPHPADVSLLDLLRSLPGLGDLLGLITGSRRDRGTGRDERR
jgi:hypothetical protein